MPGLGDKEAHNKFMATDKASGAPSLIGGSGEAVALDKEPGAGTSGKPMFGHLAGLAGLGSKIGKPPGTTSLQPSGAEIASSSQEQAAAGNQSIFSSGMFAKSAEPEKQSTDAPRSSQPPSMNSQPRSSLFSMDLPGLTSQSKPDKASTDQQPKPASSAHLLSSLESSAKNYLL